MGYFRFRRRIRLAPGIHWNIGKKGSSISFGGRGLTRTISSKASRTTVGIPGTGVSYTHVTPRSTTPPKTAMQPPPIPNNAQQVSATVNLPRVFYTLGFLVLVVWLISKGVQQAVPSGESKAIGSLGSPAAVVAVPSPSATPLEPTSTGIDFSSSNQTELNQPKAVPLQETSVPDSSPTPSTVVVEEDPRLYRVSGISPSDSLNVRAGPNSSYPVVLRLRSAAGGIKVRNSRISNGGTTWRQITIGEYSGWVNEAYLQADAGQRAIKVTHGPKLVFSPLPMYPSKARASRLTGSGRFRITFAPSGIVSHVSTVESTGSQLLDGSALNQLARWRILPGTGTELTVPISFRP